MKLKKISKGVYQTEDGLYNIEHQDNYETDCLDPHPCRIKIETDNYDPARYRSFGKFSKKWTKEGLVTYFSYYCDDGEIHYESRWIVWCNGVEGVDGDYHPNSGPHGFDTKKDAVAFLEYELTKERKAGTLTP